MQPRRIPLALAVLTALAWMNTALAQVDLATLTHASGQDGDYFGTAVAMDGETLVVGAQRDTWGGILWAGTAHVFEHLGGAWIQVAELRPSDGGPYGSFGISVAIDGDVVVVGSHGHSGVVGFGGAAYVFERGPGGWPSTETAKLVSSDLASWDSFGVSVAVSAGTILVGCEADDDGCIPGTGCSSGSAYIFERGPGGWLATETAKLRASDADVSSYFGGSVALDGERALIGARGAFAPNWFNGAAYLFERGPGGWPATETAKLMASDVIDVQGHGRSVDLRGDVAVVAGGPGSDPQGDNHGIYVYERTATGWGSYETCKLDVPDPAWYPHPFAPVALGEDRILCGGDAVFVFQRHAAGWAGAVETMRLECPDGPGAVDFGSSLALSGHRALVGCRFYDSSSQGPGKAYLFGLSIGSDVEQLSLAAGGTQALELSAGSSQAGRAYLLLGSASGTHPGIDLGSASLPLIADAYFAYTLLNLGAPPIVGNPGRLDAYGGSQASIVLPPRPDPAWAGVELHHAYLVVHPSGPVVIPFASDPVRLVLVP